MLQIYSNQTINPRKMAKNSPKWAKLRLCYVFGHTISSGFVHFILIYNISFGFSSKRAELSQTERNQACLNCSEVQPVMHGLKAQQAHSPGQAKRHPGLRIAIVLTPCKGKSIQCWK